MCQSTIFLILFKNVDFQTNGRFSLRKIQLNDDEQDKRNTAYQCLYQHGNEQMKFEYSPFDGSWKTLSHQFDSNEQNKLQTFLDNLHLTKEISFDEQVHIIITNLDQYFHGSSISSFFFKSTKQIHFVFF